jgi:IgGFc binding protein
MKLSIPLAAKLGLFGLSTAALAASACGHDRPAFEGPAHGFGDAPDASPGEPACRLQCSLDRREVIRVCPDPAGAHKQSSHVVETCSDGLACGAGTCQEPCAAAAAERSSNGCEFYMQPPRFTKAYQQACYAAFVVNTANADVNVSLSLGGEPIDISHAVYKTVPGEATLEQHDGPIAPGESVILFVSERDPALPPPGAPGAFGEFNRITRCPNGVQAATYADPVPLNTGIGTSFELKTNLPVTAATIYPFGGAPSFLPTATLLLPVATWGKEHMLVNGWESQFNSNSYAPFQPWPAAQIVASEDTDVTINPTRDIQGGPGVAGTIARRPVTYHLKKGQHLQLVQEAELTGSVVTSTKPTSSVGGQVCAKIPAQHSACDIIAQQIPSFEQWGSEYVAVGYRPRTGNEHEVMPYRIVAARDGTRLEYEPMIPPGAPVTMSAGEVATFYVGIDAPFVVRAQDAEHPIFLAAYMSGGGPGPSNSPIGGANMGGNGDPEMVNVVPSGQYMNAYSFYADPTYADTSLVVVRAKQAGEFKDVWLECAGNLTGFRPVGSRGEYEYARIDIARGGKPGSEFGSNACKNGLQQMRSEGPFTATLWGWDQYASYAYPGGMAQRKLVDTPLVPVH